MSSWLICRVCAMLMALAFSLAPRPVAADELADFNAAVERAAAHNRVAIGYLRTETVDLAIIEIDHMKSAWADLTGRYGANPPADLRDNPFYAETLIGVPVKIVGATLLLDLGRVDLARKSLQEIQLSLSKMRRESGIEILADCVVGYSVAIAAFVAYDDTPPDWTRPDMGAEVSARADAIAGAARRCDTLAGDAVRTKPEFRRLIDGTFASLDFVPKVIAERDNDLLHRLIGELRAFDNLLAFRYG